MAYDPDLTNNQGNGKFGFISGNGGGPTQAYTNPSSRAGIGSMMMAIFAGLNLLFLLVAAAYSVGLFENSEATTDGASFFILVLMTFIAGGLGLFCSYIGLRMSRLAKAPLFEMINRILFMVIIAAASLVLLGPVFN